VRAPALWRIFSHHGRQAGALNVPVSYPPEEVNGFLVGGMMSPGMQSPYAYPPALRDKLNAMGYILDVEIQKYDVEDEADAFHFLEDVEAAMEKRAEALFHLMDSQPWQFLMAVFVAADRIQHLFWKTMADEHSRFYRAPAAPRLRARILAIYRALDQLVGQIVERVDDHEHTDLFVVSDHGFGSTRAWFNANRWLQQQGWLRLHRGPALRKRLFYEAMKLNDSQLLKVLLPASLGRKARGRVRRGRSVFKTDLDQCIDWTQSQAFFASIPAQGIYINLQRNGIGLVQPGTEYESLRRQIRDGLTALVDPRDGKRVIDRVWYREEVYDGPYTHLAPDILFVGRDYGYLGRELLGTRGVVESSMNWANGFHRMNGILMAYGPSVRQGARIEGATMVDVAPTVLYGMGLPVPSNMDGRVLTDLLEPDLLAAHQVRSEVALAGAAAEDGTYSEDEMDEISGRLAALGYIE
jgi:predicted AlkP superfamily phosphohydrolase/phosphomutase